jgi:uncharacterized UBP type Zn finger protein
MTDSVIDTRPLPQYDVEITPISSINYQMLKNVTIQALNKFQTECSGTLPAEFTKYLDALIGEIDSTHKAHAVQVEKASSLSAKAELSGNDTDGILKGKDDVRSSGERSLYNFGNTCYMNSALQLMYSMDQFKDEILKKKDDSDVLKKYLSKMNTGVNSSENLANELYEFSGIKTKNNNRDFGHQEDPSELIISIFEKYEDASKKTFKFTSSDSKVYNGKEKIDTKCTSIDTNAKTKITDDKSNIIVLFKENPSEILQLSITSSGSTDTKISFKQIFEAYTQETDIEEKVDDSKNTHNLTHTDGIIFNLPDCMMDNPNQSKVLNDACKQLIKVETSANGKFKLVNIKNKTYVFPGKDQQYFIVLLKRYNYNVGSGKTTKNTTPIDLTSASIKLGTSTFTIKGCICHHGGNPHAGHYTYVEFESGTPTTVYDDTNICPYNTYITIESFKDRTVDVTGYVLLFEKEK